MKLSQSVSRYCSLIYLPAQPKYQMRGVCQESGVDALYFLQVQGKRELIGFKQTTLIWSNKSNRWDIVNLMDKNVLAYTNSTEEFPFGTHHWFFTAGGCTDPGQSWRTINLQQVSQQPGQFCCDNGLCIVSEYRCDNKYHCQDESDEIGCSIVQVDAKRYNSQMPPYRIEWRGKNKLFRASDVNVSIELQDILGIRGSETWKLWKRRFHPQ